MTLTDDWVALLRERLPYGMWTLNAGGEVLFNRRYEPRWQRQPGQPATRVADRTWWVPFVQQRWFFNDDDPPWCALPRYLKHKRERARLTRQRCETALEAFLLGQPVPDELFQHEVRPREQQRAAPAAPA